MKPQFDLFSFVFWRKLKTPKRHFEIIWPLVEGETFLLLFRLALAKLCLWELYLNSWYYPLINYLIQNNWPTVDQNYQEIKSSFEPICKNDDHSSLPILKNISYLEISWYLIQSLIFLPREWKLPNFLLIDKLILIKFSTLSEKNLGEVVTFRKNYAAAESR